MQAQGLEFDLHFLKKPHMAMSTCDPKAGERQGQADPWGLLRVALCGKGQANEKAQLKK